MRPDVAACRGQQPLPGYMGSAVAPHFSTAVGPDTYTKWLKAVPPHATASLYLHVPFCRSICWFCDRHTAVCRRDEPIAVYEAALRCEIDLVARQIDRRLKVGRIHFGGGTPTIMAPESFTDLIGSLRHCFFVLPSAEIAVEADPRSLSGAMIDALAYGGVNQASLGVPSFDSVVQRAVNRMQGFDETAAAVRGLRRAGIEAVDFGLVYGLPRQTVASCLDTVRRCVELRPDRFAVSGYVHLPNEHQRKIDGAWLPDGLERLDQFNAIANALKEAGYGQIGPDRFALADDAAAAPRQGRPLRNAFGDTTGLDELLIGFGAGAIGKLPQGYVRNAIDTAAYSEAIAGGGLATAEGCAWPGDSHAYASGVTAVVDAPLGGSRRLHRMAG
jgi:oxygen-independent coproporphyrinogen III oxidase